MHAASALRIIRRRLLPSALGLGCVTAAAQAADPVRGAMLYLRTDSDVRSCVSCHGPDPGQGRNNILLAADRPANLGRALNTVGAMGFLASQLTSTDRADIAAYLGVVARMNAADSPLQIWPPTLEFGQVATGARSATQTVRVRNGSQSPVNIGPLSASPAELLMQHDCPAALPAGQSCDVHLQWVPGATGLLRGTARISSPQLAVPAIVGAWTRGDAGSPSALRWSASEATTRFDSGSQAAVTQVLALTNPGPMPAVLGTASITGPGATRFQLAGCAADSVLQAGTSCSLTIVYTPDLLTQVQATLQMRSDQGNPASLRLVGTAIAPEQPQALEPTAAPLASDGGGGCSAGPPDRRADPLLLAAALAALLGAVRRRRPR